jgi:predicted dehydrogenase
LKKKINIAIIGAGRSGEKIHLVNILKFKEINLAGIFDNNIKKSLSLSKKYNIKYFKNINQILQDQSIDIVIIATPSNTHYELCKKIIAKKSVILEKPLTKNLTSLKKLISLKKKYKNHIYPFFNFRFNKENQIIKKILTKNLIGKILYIKKNIKSFNIREDWQSKKKYLGGVFNANGLHYLDQVLNVLLNNFDKIKIRNSIKRNYISKGDAEDFIKINLEIKQILVDLEFSWIDSTNFNTSELTILGSKGSILCINNKVYLKFFRKKSLKNNDYKNLYLSSKKPDWIKKNYSTPLTQVFQGAAEIFYKKVMNSYIKGDKFEITDSQMIKLQKIVDEI